MICWFCSLREAQVKHTYGIDMYGEVDAETTSALTDVPIGFAMWRFLVAPIVIGGIDRRVLRPILVFFFHCSGRGGAGNYSEMDAAADLRYLARIGPSGWCWRLWFPSN